MLKNVHGACSGTTYTYSIKPHADWCELKKLIETIVVNIIFSDVYKPITKPLSSQTKVECDKVI